MTAADRAQIAAQLEERVRQTDWGRYERQRIRERILEILPPGCGLDTLELAEAIDEEQVEPDSPFFRRVAAVMRALVREGQFTWEIVCWMRAGKRGGP